MANNSLANRLLKSSEEGGGIIDTKLIDRVKALLEDERNENYIDNLDALVAHIWFQDYENALGERASANTSAYDAFIFLGQNKFTPFKEIESACNYIQEKHEHLRGEKYELRRNKKEISSNKGKRRLAGNRSKKSPGEDSE